MKKLRIYVVEKDVEKADTLATRLNENKRVLNSYDIEFVAGRFDYKHPFDPVVLSQARPDMLIIDYSTANLKSSSSNISIAEQIKRQLPFLPIILTHRGDPRERYRILKSELSTKSIESVKLFDGFIDPWMKTSDIQKTVKTNLRKPLDIGIIGLGVLGRQFLRIFARANEVKRIKAYSEHVPSDLVLNLIDHLGARKDKIIVNNTLEECLENTDCVLICTSAVHASSLAERVAKEDSRLDLLQQEGAKLFSYFKRIKQADYQGLITPFTNPVAGMLYLAKITGIKQNQLTSPISIDNARFDDAIRGEMGRDYAFFINALLAGKIVGDHGVPHFAQLEDRTTKGSNIIDYQKALERINEIINKALIKTRQMPKKALQSAALLEEKGYEAAAESARFYRRLAHLDEIPNESAYCYYKINGNEGFTSLPVKISYFPNIRISPNENYIRAFNKKTIKNLKEQLRLQELYTKEFLSSGILEETK